MTLLQPEAYVVDAYEWRLDEDGILRAGDASCLVMVPESQVPCGSEVDEGFVRYLDSVATGAFGIGEGADFREGYRFSARLVADATLVVEGEDGRTLRYDGLPVPDPQVSAVQPMSVLSDGASLVVTSASDPSYIEVLVQDVEQPDRLRPLEAVGEVDLANEGEVRTWQTADGGVVTVTAREDGSWTAWSWMMVSRTEMAALPWGTVCFDDVDDPSTARPC